MSSEPPQTGHGDDGPSRVAAARARMANGDWPAPLAVADAILASGLLWRRGQPRSPLATPT